MGATTEYRFDGLDRSEKRLSQMIEQEPLSFASWSSRLPMNCRAG